VYTYTYIHIYICTFITYTEEQGGEEEVQTKIAKTKVKASKTKKGSKHTKIAKADSLQVFIDENMHAYDDYMYIYMCMYIYICIYRYIYNVYLSRYEYIYVYVCETYEDF
jgi:hypothetical protein